MKYDRASRYSEVQRGGPHHMTCQVRTNQNVAGIATARLADILEVQQPRYLASCPVCTE